MLYCTSFPSLPPPLPPPCNTFVRLSLVCYILTHFSPYPTLLIIVFLIFPSSSLSLSISPLSFSPFIHPPSPLSSSLLRSTAAAVAALQAGAGVVRVQYHYYNPTQSPPTTTNGLRKRKKKLMMVLIIGGISLLEVAAFRCLSADPAFPFSIVVASTSIISGNTLVEAMYF